MEEEEYQSTVEALHDYEAQNDNCLSFKAGDILHVINTDPSGWWDGVLNGERGWFPSNYVQVVTRKQRHSAEPQSEKSSEGYSSHSDQFEQHHEQLPTDWRVKESREGTLYYVNTRTNQTTWTLSDVYAIENGERQAHNFSNPFDILFLKHCL